MIFLKNNINFIKVYIIITIMQLEIEKLNLNGDGYGFVNGKKVIIPKTAVGDILSYKIVKENKDYILGKIEKIIYPSKDRLKTIDCGIYEKCGGCNLLHLTETAYINFKKSIIENTLKKSGYDINYNLISMGFFTRRRVIFKVHNSKIGFFEKSSNNLVEVKYCPLINQDINKIIPLLEDISKKINMEEISITKYDNGLGIMFTLKKNLTLDDDRILRSFIHSSDKIILISYKINNEEPSLYFQKYAPVIKFNNNITVELESDIFLQATKEGQDAITNIVVNHLKNCKNVLDLYCGIGTYSFPLSQYTKVHSIEGSQRMIDILSRNIKNNSLSNKITAECKNLVNSPLLKDELNKYDGLVINPPRNGALAQCKHITKSSIKNIVMVSCNPQTFSIDAEELRKAGYKMTSLTGIDQFFRTSHLEIVATLEK